MEITTALEIDSLALEAIIKKEFVKIFNKILGAALELSLGEARLVIRQAIMNSPEYYSLLGNGPTDLQAHFGLIAPTTVVNSIIDELLKGVTGKFDKPRATSSGFAGGISIAVLRGDYSDVLSAKGVSYTSKGNTVDWLNWLLFEGVKPLTQIGNVQYDITFGFYPQARSRKAIMTQQRSTWHVPTEFAGVAGNNWLTRALADIEKKIGEIMFIEIKKAL